MFKEILGDAFPLLEKYAPMVASTLGSPIAGSATAFVLNSLRTSFGINDPDISKLGAAIVSSNDACDILSQLESNLKNIRLPSSIEINIKLAWNP